MVAIFTNNAVAAQTQNISVRSSIFSMMLHLTQRKLYTT
jgi:hypothetical protein